MTQLRSLLESTIWGQVQWNSSAEEKCRKRRSFRKQTRAPIYLWRECSCELTIHLHFYLLISTIAKWNSWICAVSRCRRSIQLQMMNGWCWTSQKLTSARCSTANGMKVYCFIFYSPKNYIPLSCLLFTIRTKSILLINKIL